MTSDVPVCKVCGSWFVEGRGDDTAEHGLCFSCASRTLDACQCERLRRALWSVIDTFEGAVANFRSRGAGGQHVPFHGDFAQVPPSAVGQMERWARDLRSALRGEWPYTKEEWVKEWGSAGVEEMFKEREP